MHASSSGLAATAASDALASPVNSQGDLQGAPCAAAADGLVHVQVACGTAAQEGLRARLAEEQQARAALEAEAPHLRSCAQTAQQERAELEQDLADLQRQARQVGVHSSGLQRVACVWRVPSRLGLHCQVAVSEPPLPPGRQVIPTDRVMHVSALSATLLHKLCITAAPLARAC